MTFRVRMGTTGQMGSDQLDLLLSESTVSLWLTKDQEAVLQPLLDARLTHKKSAIISLASVSYEPDLGHAIAKLDVAWVPWRIAEKVVGIIRANTE